MTNNAITSAEPLLKIVPLYAAMLSLLFIYLTLRVVNQRKKARVAIGDGNNPVLRRAIAVHNNFAQYVPLALVLITFIELNHAPAFLVQTLCIILLLARLLHAYGVSQEKENLKLRKIAVISTLAVYIVSAVCIAIQALSL
jgi:uncharacterized protein